MSAPAPEVASSAPKPILLHTALNFSSLAFAALATLVCLPIYRRLLGVEAFGVIGLNLTLQTLLRALDLGLTPTVIREMARASATSEGRAELPSVARTFAIVVAVVAGLIALGVCLAAPFVAQSWIQRETLSLRTVTLCLAAMGIQGGINMLSLFYQNALMGLERQPVYNAIRIVEIACNTLGGVLVLILCDARIELFLAWQALVGVAGLAAYAFALRRALNRAQAPDAAPAAFQLAFVRRTWRFASGMIWITSTGIVLTNMDKIWLSKCLSLGDYGNYSLAFFMVTTVFATLVTPPFNVVFPRISHLAAVGDTNLIGDLYHLMVQGLAAIALTLVVLFEVFGGDAIALWTADASIAPIMSRLLTLFAVGLAFNSLMLPAYALQVSHGWTSLGVTVNLFLIAVFGPLLIMLQSRYGAEGGAINYAAINMTYLIVALPITIARLLPTQSIASFVFDIVPSLLVNVGGYLVLCWLFAVWPIAGVEKLGIGVVSGGLLMAISALASSRIRREILGKTNLFRPLRPPESESPMSTKLRSHSQFQEDLELVHFFGRDFRGRFLEVGGNDGVSGSPTYLLERLGWTGVLVEPNERLAALCRERRPGSVVVAKAAVGDPSVAFVDLYECGDGTDGVRYDGMSSIVPGHANQPGGAVRVPAATVDAMLAEAALEGPLDFVSIDVEGAELDVLRGLSLATLKPRILLIEDNDFGAAPAVEVHLGRYGYRKVARSFVNDWYVSAACVDVPRPIRYSLISYLEFKYTAAMLDFHKRPGFYPTMRSMMKAEGSLFWPIKFSVFRMTPARVFRRVLVWGVRLKAKLFGPGDVA